MLSSTLGQVLQHARLPDLTARPGAMPVRCFALRLDAQHGVADVRALLLDTNLFYLEGSGSLNLGDETLALRLRPLARLGGTGVIVPLKVQGPFRNPKVEVDATGAAGEAAGIAAQAAAQPAARRHHRRARRRPDGARRGGDDCARDLALARGGRAGPLPAAPRPLPRRRKAEGAEAGRPAAPVSALTSERRGIVKRFWDYASIAPSGPGWAILLDGKPMHLPGGGTLCLASASLARGIAAEWQAAGGAKGGEMSFADTPLTRLAGTAQERVAPDPAPDRRRTGPLRRD